MYKSVATHQLTTSEDVKAEVPGSNSSSDVAVGSRARLLTTLLVSSSLK